MRLVDEIVKLNIAWDSFESLLYSFHHQLSIPEGKFNTVVHLCQVGVGLLSFQRETRSEEHTSELQSRGHLVCRLLLEKKKIRKVSAAQVAASGRSNCG